MTDQASSYRWNQGQGTAFHFFPKPELAKVDIGSRSLMPPATLNGKEVDDLVSYLLHAGQENAKQSPAHSSKPDGDDN